MKRLLLLLIGFGFLIAFAISTISTLNFVSNSKVTTAKIIDVKDKKTRKDGKTKRTYAPVFKFSDDSGKNYTVSSNTYTSSKYRINSSVEVRYSIDKPSSAKINSFMRIWGLPIVLGILGFLLPIASIFGKTVQ